MFNRLYKAETLTCKHCRNKNIIISKTFSKIKVYCSKCSKSNNQLLNNISVNKLNKLYLYFDDRCIICKGKLKYPGSNILLCPECNRKTTTINKTYHYNNIRNDNRSITIGESEFNNLIKLKAMKLLKDNNIKRIG